MGGKFLIAAAALIALTGCGKTQSGEAAEPAATPPLIDAWERCALERGNYARLTDTPEVLIEGTGIGDLLGARMAFECISDISGAPESLMQKVDATRPVDGRQHVTYNDITVSWTYRIDGDDQSFEAVFEPASGTGPS